MCAYPVFHVGSRSHSHVLVLGQQPLYWRNYQPYDLEECLWSSRNSGFWVLGLWSEMIRMGEGRVGESTAHELWWADSYWYLIEKVIISLNLLSPPSTLPFLSTCARTKCQDSVAHRGSELSVSRWLASYSRTQLQPSRLQRQIKQNNRRKSKYSIGEQWLMKVGFSRSPRF